MEGKERIRIVDGPHGREALEPLVENGQTTTFRTHEGTDFKARITALSGMSGRIGNLMVRLVHDGNEYEGHYNYVHHKGEFQLS